MKKQTITLNLVDIRSLNQQQVHKSLIEHLAHIEHSYHHFYFSSYNQSILHTSLITYTANSEIHKMNWITFVTESA